jgi:transcriptional regulator with XRE-family HTH domain
MESPRGLSRSVGAQVKLIRQQHGATAEEVGAAARAFGLSWRRATVSQIENGERGLSAEELVLLPLLLGWLGLPNTWTDLVGDGDDLRLGPEVSVPRWVVIEVLSRSDDDELHLGEVDAPHLEQLRAGQQRLADRLPELAAWWRAAWPQGTVAQHRQAKTSAAYEAEKRAASKLGVPPLVLAIAAHRTWDRGLTEERDRRVVEQTNDDASPRTVQAVRGHVTRRLIAEVEPMAREIAAAVDDVEEA